MDLYLRSYRFTPLPHPAEASEIYCLQTVLQDEQTQQLSRLRAQSYPKRLHAT